MNNSVLSELAERSVLELLLCSFSSLFNLYPTGVDIWILKRGV
jgi:hypothetical protein